MGKIIILLTLCFALFRINPASDLRAMSQQSLQTGDDLPIEKVDFHYVIFSNKVIYPDQPKLTRRYVSVLLDKEAFSEYTLKELFRVLAKAFPTPELLSVEVITDGKQTTTPEPTTSGVEPSPDYYNYHGATYLRAKEVEFFRYTISPPNRELKTVTLKSLQR